MALVFNQWKMFLRRLPSPVSFRSLDRHGTEPENGKGRIDMPHTNILEADLAALVVVDVQEKMLAAVTTSPAESIVQNIIRLAGAARILDIPVLYTEQYPEGLGPTVPAVKAALPDDLAPIIKSTCSCWRWEAFRDRLRATEREHVILAGLETHVCIQQTALDLVRVDYVPFVAADAVGSRRASDTERAFARMQHAGAEVSTTEALIFEWVERCDHPRFKDILKLVK